jgi:hypothetical protein
MNTEIQGNTTTMENKQRKLNSKLSSTKVKLIIEEENDQIIRKDLLENMLLMLSNKNISGKDLFDLLMEEN